MRHFRFSHLRPTALIALLLIILPIGGCGSGKTVSDTRFLLDTECTLTLYDQSDNSLLEQSFALVGDYERQFSRTVEGSDIWNINHAAGASVSVGSATIELLQLSQHYAVLSDGRFDISIGALSSLWDFGNAAAPPDESAIETARSHVDYRDIFIDSLNQQVQLTDEQAELDSGGIAKGYIADRLAAFFIENNVDCACVSLGGNVVTIGSKPDGSPWNVGVEQPFSEHTALVGILTYSSEKPISIVTSGIYERNFTYEGQLYHHIIDPRSGYPCHSGLTAVSIISDSSADGDALSTVCLLLGYEQGDALLRSLAGIHAAIWQFDDESITFTDYDGLVGFTPQE